ncbi:MAG: hypothetical protein K2M87_08405 [Muribaculaceae bacterium]|nr:hypothetical protein [Muribaculaceae bacterium]
MKRHIYSAILIATSLCAFADNDLLRITLNDGSCQTLHVADIKEISFEDGSEESLAAKFIGTWSGTQTVTIGGTFSYTAEIPVVITAGEGSQSISVSYPEYSLAGTMMGDITLGTLNIVGLEWNDEKGGFYLNYGGQGLTQHFKAIKDGNVTMDSDYPLNEPSSILVTLTDNGGIKIENHFKLGAMPFPINSTFEGVNQ